MKRACFAVAAWPCEGRCGTSSETAAEVRKRNKKWQFGGFHGLGCLWLGGTRSRDYLPARATLNVQSTRHGARPGPTLAPTVVYTRPPCVPRCRGREERPAAGRETVSMCKKSALGRRFEVYIYLVPGMCYFLVGMNCPTPTPEFIPLTCHAVLKRG